MPSQGFLKVIEKLFDFIFLTVLFFLTTGLTLGVGLGASVYAYYRVMFLLDRDDTASVFKTYIKAFKDEFIKSTVLWLLMVILLYGNFFIRQNAEILGNESFYSALNVFQLILIFIYALILAYAFPVYAFFNISLKKSLSIAPYFIVRYMVLTIFSGLFWGLLFYLTNESGILIPFFLSVYLYFSSIIFNVLLKKHAKNDKV